MPRVQVRYFEDERGSVPVKEWLERLRRQDRHAYARCHAALRRLAAAGHELRRPHCDYVRSGVYELRARSGRTQLRILYCFFGQIAVVLIHALTKEDRIAEFDIARALARKRAFEANPEERSHERNWADE